MIDASRLVLIWRIPKNAATMQKDQAVLFMLLTGHRRNLGGGAGTADALSGHRAAGNRGGLALSMPFISVVLKTRNR